MRKLLSRLRDAMALTVVPLVALTLPATAEQPVTHFKLDNGMDVVVIEDNRAAVVTHMVWYRIGAADEPPGASGIAHFVEHLMFKGTDEIPDGAFSKIVRENGGQDNAFTSLDYTGYFQRIASDRLELVMKMEADRMTDLVLTPEHITTERDVIIEERNERTDNSPTSLFYEQASAALYMNHPYGIPIIGWKREMEQLSEEDVWSFYRRYYAPDNAILVVAGNVTPDQVRALAETYYGTIKAANNPPDARPQEPPQLAARRMAMTDPRVREDYVMRLYLVPNYDPAAPKTAASLSILSSIMGSGLTSRFGQSLQVEQKLAIDTDTWYSALSRDDTEFGIWATAAPGVSIEKVEAALDAELDKMASEGPTAEELARIKRVMRASRIFSQDNVSSLARLYGRAMTSGFSVADVQAWPDAIESVTIEDVKNAAALLKIERSVTGTLSRAEGKS